MMHDWIKTAFREVLSEIATELVTVAVAWYGVNKATIPPDLAPFAAEAIVLANQFLAPPTPVPPVTK